MSDNYCIVCGVSIPGGRQVCPVCATSPCPRDCPNRTTDCKFDGTCTRYQVWNEWHTARRIEAHTQRENEAAFMDAKKHLRRKKH